MSDLTDDDIDLDDEEELAPDLLEQVQRLQAHIDRRDERERIARSYGRRRQIEEWMDERARRGRVDYLDVELSRDDRHRHRLGR